MNLVDLVLGIKKKHHRQMLAYENFFSQNFSENTDDYSKFIQFYQTLNNEEKRLVSSFIEQSITDTTSSIFAWLDGVSFLEGQPKKSLELKYEGEECKLNGHLQDIWLAIQEGCDVEELREFYSNSVFYENET